MTRILVINALFLALVVGCRESTSTANSKGPGSEAIQRVLQRHAELVKYRARS